MGDVINLFIDEYRFLSNFWLASIEFEGRKYPSVENAYQAAKTLDLKKREPFEKYTPGQAKRAGKKLTLRPDWDKSRIKYMEILLRQKFFHLDLQRQLLGTGEKTLIEGNDWHDTFWGVCDGCGENNLGRLLMTIRKDLGK